MNVEAIPALGAHDEVAAGAPLRELASAPPAAAFTQLVSEGLQQLNGQLLASQLDLQRLAAGEVTNLHEVMARLEESRIALQLVLQVRNRALEAYQDLLRMQV
jgi:flagellar hook-basal body complex protein FliE